ncbi:hypothetical protein T06_3597 [Trichinella sp. T6]|nr:hypothetical protein T06_3597 [Trichinella sp. T6]
MAIRIAFHLMLAFQLTKQLPSVRFDSQQFMIILLQNWKSLLPLKKCYC